MLEPLPCPCPQQKSIFLGGISTSSYISLIVICLSLAPSQSSSNPPPLPSLPPSALPSSKRTDHGLLQVHELVHLATLLGLLLGLAPYCFLLIVKVWVGVSKGMGQSAGEEEHFWSPAGMLPNDACVMTTGPTYLNVVENPEQGLELCVHIGHGWSTRRVPVLRSGGGVSLCVVLVVVWGESCCECMGPRAEMRVAWLASLYPKVFDPGQSHATSTLSDL